MTKDIVQSDIDMARRLLDARRPTAEILAALLRRGIAQPVALRLIGDLQAGRTVTPRLPLPERVGRATARSSSSEERQDADGNDEIEEPPAFPPAPKAKVPGRFSRILFLVVLAVSLVGGGWYYAYHLKAHILLMELQRAADDLAAASPETKEGKLKEATELRGIINQWHYLDSREISVLKRIEGQLNALEPGSATNAPSKSVPDRIKLPGLTGA